MIGAKQRRDSVLLARAGEREPLRPADALLPFDHQAELHERSSFTRESLCDEADDDAFVWLERQRQQVDRAAGTRRVG